MQRMHCLLINVYSLFLCLFCACILHSCTESLTLAFLWVLRSFFLLFYRDLNWVQYGIVQLERKCIFMLLVHIWHVKRDLCDGNDNLREYNRHYIIRAGYYNGSIEVPKTQCNVIKIIREIHKLVNLADIDAFEGVCWLIFNRII